jgi:hypothetical protein
MIAKAFLRLAAEGRKPFMIMEIPPGGTGA